MNLLQKLIHNPDFKIDFAHFSSISKFVTGFDLLHFAISNNPDNNIKIFIQTCVSVGICITGATMLIIAILDPEPMSKLSFLIGSGVLLLTAGMIAALASLGQNWDLKIGKTNDAKQ